MTRFPPPEVVIRPPGRTPAVMGADPKTVLRRAGHQDRRPQSPAPLRETEPRAGAVHETRDRSRGSHPRVLWYPYFDKIPAPRASRMMPPLIGTPGTGSKGRAHAAAVGPQAARARSEVRSSPSPSPRRLSSSAAPSSPGLRPRVTAPLLVHGHRSAPADEGGREKARGQAGSSGRTGGQKAFRARLSRGSPLSRTPGRASRTDPDGRSVRSSVLFRAP